MNEPHSNFVFTLCQRGAEPALKREIARLLPAWKPAYQRPGLVTFKAPEALPADVALSSVFARSHGLSLGSVRDVAELTQKLASLPQPLCLQVVEPDKFRPDEEPPGFVPGAEARRLDAEIRAALPEVFGRARLPRGGEWVLSVIASGADPWLLGLHRHRAERCAHPGGRFPVEVPAESPSRAYAKIEEAIGLFQLPVRAGDVALEIGASPGGAAYALLRRGVSVIGVDPGAMAESVLEFVGPRQARLVHHAIPVAELKRELLPAHVDWLLLDVHLAPQVALRAARRLASWYRGELLGAVLTLKLNDWAFADDVASYLHQAREMDLVNPVAKQFGSHRQELAIVGLTPRGRTRVR